MSDTLVKVDKNDQVITITLDNPPVNAVSTKVLVMPNRAASWVRSTRFLP